MGFYAKIAGLPVEIERIRLEPLDLDVGGWVRRSTVVCLDGRGHTGAGEDISYWGADQEAFRDRGPGVEPPGRTTLDAFSRGLDDHALFPHPQDGPVGRRYRRWAFESAALDLALLQAGTSLGELLGLEASPVTFVLSCGLGEPATLDPVRRRLQRYPGCRFKLDFAESWTVELIEELARLDVVDVVDLKGLYRGCFQGPPAVAPLYRAIAERLPRIWIEDPELNDETDPVLEPFRNRITWDVPLHSAADLALQPFRPRTVNIKPSRFGSLADLFAVYEYCRDHDIAMYGGGQFELGPGRTQIQLLASLFHPDAPNDVAPIGYHDPGLTPGLASSPLPAPGTVAGTVAGFR